MPSRPENPYLPEKFAAARRLRNSGTPMKQIATELGVSVSTVSLWVRDIALTEEQKAANRLRAAAYRSDRWRERNRARRLSYQEEGRRRARMGDPLHLGGCMLYWCEGNKARNQARLVNSDRPLIVFFARFLRECFELRPERFVVSLNVYTGNGLSMEEIERHWLDALDLPRQCLRKHQLNHTPTSSSGRKKNKLPYGVCSIGVTRSTAIVQHIYGAIQEYGDFDEPRWLDGFY